MKIFKKGGEKMSNNVMPDYMNDYDEYWETPKVSEFIIYASLADAFAQGGDMDDLVQIVNFFPDPVMNLKVWKDFMKDLEGAQIYL